MANPNKPSGLSPLKYLNGSPWNQKANLYYIDSADANAFNCGDPVKLSGTGDVTRGVPGITLATAGATMVGVILAAGVNPDGGPYADPANLNIVGVPATKTKNYYALVVDDPFVVFEMQEIGTGTPLAATNIGENINFVAGSPAAGAVYSGFLLDNTAHDTSSTKNLKLMRLVRRADNALGAYSKWEVIINNHSYKVGVTGI